MWPSARATAAPRCRPIAARDATEPVSQRVNEFQTAPPPRSHFRRLGAADDRGCAACGYAQNYRFGWTARHWPSVRGAFSGVRGQGSIRAGQLHLLRLGLTQELIGQVVIDQWPGGAAGHWRNCRTPPRSLAAHVLREPPCCGARAGPRHQPGGTDRPPARRARRPGRRCLWLAALGQGLGARKCLVVPG